ncbi:MAG: hypothetical protein R3F11_17960 [Verrucomicrobiales bacterium]
MAGRVAQDKVAVLGIAARLVALQAGPRADLGPDFVGEERGVLDPARMRRHRRCRIALRPCGAAKRGEAKREQQRGAAGEWMDGRSDHGIASIIRLDRTEAR